jgi:TP901 family phage tail tape measure protein
MPPRRNKVDILIKAQDKASATMKKVESNSKRLGGGFANLQTQAKGLRTGFASLSQALGPLGLAGGMIGGVMAVKQMIGTMVNFESAMAEVSTLVDTSTTDMGHLSDEILKLSTTVPRSAIDLSKGLYQTISAGVTDAADSMELLAIASKAAVGGITDTNTSVDAITTVMNSYGLSVRDANAISDMFFTTIKEGKTTFPELAAGIGTVASSAALAGVSFDELGAAIATITKGGIDTMTTTTALNRLFMTMTNPTEQVIKATKNLGVEFSAAALRSKGFAQFMKELTVALEKDQDAVFSLGLDVRAFRALAILGGTGAEEFATQIDNMAVKAGAADMAFGRMADTVKNKWNVAVNKFNKTIIETGSVGLPILTKAIEAFTARLEHPFSLMPQYDKALKDMSLAHKEAKEAASGHTEELISFSDSLKDVPKLAEDLSKASGAEEGGFFSQLVKTFAALNPLMAAAANQLLKQDQIAEKAGGGWFALAGFMKEAAKAQQALLKAAPGKLLTEEAQALLDIKEKLLKQDAQALLTAQAKLEIEAERRGLSVEEWKRIKDLQTLKERLLEQEAQTLLVLQAKLEIEAERQKLLEQEFTKEGIKLQFRKVTAEEISQIRERDLVIANTIKKAEEDILEFVRRQKEEFGRITDEMQEQLDIQLSFMNLSRAAIINQHGLFMAATQTADVLGRMVFSAGSLADELERALRSFLRMGLRGLAGGAVASMIPGVGFLEGFAAATGLGGMFGLPGGQHGLDFKVAADQVLIRMLWQCA